MNKQQIILPIVVLVIVAIVVGLIHGRIQTREYVRAKSIETGNELIRGTNSAFFGKIDPSIRGDLAGFLHAPTKIEGILFGDAHPPIGDGSATSRLYLINDRRERLMVRLRYDRKHEKFEVIGVSTLPDASNIPQP